VTSSGDIFSSTCVANADRNVFRLSPATPVLRLLTDLDPSPSCFLNEEGWITGLTSGEFLSCQKVLEELCENKDKNVDFAVSVCHKDGAAFSPVVATGKAEIQAAIDAGDLLPKTELPGGSINEACEFDRTTDCPCLVGDLVEAEFVSICPYPFLAMPRCFDGTAAVTLIQSLTLLEHGPSSSSHSLTF